MSGEWNPYGIKEFVRGYTLVALALLLAGYAVLPLVGIAFFGSLGAAPWSVSLRLGLATGVTLGAMTSAVAALDAGRAGLRWVMLSVILLATSVALVAQLMSRR